ncbi:MAG: GAF domain-containing protein [Proteobacteria bacterium]|nr:GAF domain-containing protein [Pseudomonadota bacterium]
MSDLVMILDLDHKILAANPATLTATGLSESEIIGRCCYDVFHGKKQAPLGCPHEAMIESAEPKTSSIQMEMLGRVYAVTAAPIFDDQGRISRVAYTGKDITDHDKSKHELQTINHALNTLIECNKILSQSSDEQTLLQQICNVIVDIGGYRLAWIGFALNDKEKNVQPIAHHGFNDNYLETIHITWADTERGQGPTGTAIRTGKPVICQNILNDPRFLPWRDQAVKRGYGSSVSLPLLVDKKVIGALNIYAIEENAFNEQALGLLLGLAADIAYGISSSRISVERRQRESELAKKESEWTNAMDFIEDAVYLIDLDDKVRHANKNFYNLTGLSPEQVIGKDISSIMHPEGEAEPCPVCFARINRKDTFIIMDADHPENPVGLPIQVMVKIIRDNKQAPVSILMGIHDLSPVEELRKQGQIINQINEVVITTDLQGTITTWNNGAVKLIGYGIEEAIGQNISYLLADKISYSEVTAFPTLEVAIVKKSGNSFYGVISSSNLYNQVGQKKGTIFIIKDISQRKKAEKNQENQTRIWGLGADISHAVTAGVNQQVMLQNCCESIVRWLNASFSRIWIYDAAKDMLILQASAGMYTHIDGEHGQMSVNSHTKIGQIALEKKAILTNKVIGDPQISNQEWAKREGMIAFAGHPLLVGDTVVGVMALFSRQPLSSFILKSLESVAERIAIGIERKLAEAEKETLHTMIRQMQKMEAIGTLAGGIAHDFNNILTPILGYGDLLKLELDENNPAQESVTQILKAAMRAKELVLQMLAFSRQREQQRQPLQPHLIIKEALKLLRASIPSTIEIVEKIDPQCGTIMADPTEIHQIVMNLCTNAYQAMQETGGTMEVRIESVTINNEIARSNPNLLEGPYVRLTIKDSGPGIDPATQERIFEPYFTTKEIGEGTGMGLALVHGIVQSLNGAIVVDCPIGKGSSFSIYLPSIKKSYTESLPTRQDIPRGTEKILLIDDEQSVAEFGLKALTLIGYDVTVRTSSIEALQLFQSDPARFDLIITDQMMPNMTGIQLCQKIKEIRADIPVILLTGFSHNLRAEQTEKAGIRKCVMKPLLIEEIAHGIRDVLDS